MAMDLGRKQTDDMLRATEKRIREIYAQAARETEQKLNNHLSKYKDKYEAKLAEVVQGKISRADFLKWNKGQIMMGKRWQEMKDTLVADMYNADKLANSVINGYLPDVYALNHNYGTYEVEKGSKVDTSYTLYDRPTVERLIRDDPKLIPSPKLDKNKDIRWNSSRFNSGITQGLLQGESIQAIAKRVSLGMSSSDMQAAIRNARTATTGAENGGRLDSYYRATEMGIPVKKVWVAIMDNRTRDSHAVLDGERAEPDEPFSNGLMFPGDPEGDDPAEIWNCRCSMISDIGQSMDLWDARRNPDLGDMTYEEWKDMHSGMGDMDTPMLTSELSRASSYDEIEDYFQNRHGIDISASVRRLDFEHTKTAMQGIDDALRKYPVLKGNITRMSADNGPYIGVKGNEIHFNPYMFKKGLWFSAEDAYESGAHQIGTMLSNVIDQKVKGGTSGLVGRVLNKVGKMDAFNDYDPIQIRRTISDTAAVGSRETLSESLGYEMLRRNKGISGYEDPAGAIVAREVVKAVDRSVRGLMR